MFLKDINTKNKIALITGAGKGIGKACAIALAEAGAHVIIISRTEKDLIEVQKIIKKQIVSFNFEEAKELIKKTNDLELLVKKNPNSSLNLTTDFVISHTK